MPAKKRFEQLMSSLEAITAQLEGEQTDLETSLKLFGQGQAIMREAQQRLTEIEHEFTILNNRPDPAPDGSDA